MLTDSEDDFTDSAGGSDPDYKHTTDSNGDAGSKELNVLSSNDDRSYDDLDGRSGGTPLAAVINIHSGET